MWFIRTSKVRTDPLGKLFGGQQTIPFDHIALGVNPFGFDRVDKGGFSWAKRRAEYAPLCHPASPAGYVHDSRSAPVCSHERKRYRETQQPGRLALRLQSSTTPFQKLGGHGADGAGSRQSEATSASEQDRKPFPAAKEPHNKRRLLGQGHLSARTVLPGGQAGLYFARHVCGARQVCSTIFRPETQLPSLAVGSPRRSADRVRFFSRYWGSGLVIQCLARFQLVPKRLRARRTLATETWVGGNSLLETDLGRQFQCPGPALTAYVAWTAVQQVSQALAPVPREGASQAMGARRTSLEDGECCCVEGFDHIANRLVVAA